MIKPAVQSTSVLSAEKVAAYCVAGTQSAQPLTIEVIAQTGSTNTDLMARISSLTNPTVLIAETQTAGRGRVGRRWLSARGSSLTFSLAWPFSKSTTQALSGLPLAVGVALAQALKSMDVTVQLKWPNDVLKDGKKLAGVLIETSSHADQIWAVIGVGLNLSISEQLEQKIGHPAADVTWLAQMERNQLLATLINHLVSCLQQFAATGFAAFLPTWNALHAYAGQQISLLDHGQVIGQGTALGVNDSGCLLVQDEHGVVWPVVAGDVSLRAQGEQHAVIN